MKIQVNAATSQYDVTIGPNILAATLKEYEHILQKADRIVLLTDENVWAAHEQYVRACIT